MKSLFELEPRDWVPMAVAGVILVCLMLTIAEAATAYRRRLPCEAFLNATAHSVPARCADFVDRRLLGR